MAMAQRERKKKPAVKKKPSSDTTPPSNIVLLSSVRPFSQITRHFSTSILFSNRLVSFTRADAYLRLGQLLTANGRDFEAIEILTKGLKVDISQTKDIKVNELARIESLVKLASIYVEGGDPIQGLTTYVEAVATAPSYYKPQVCGPFCSSK
ncbi:hypothetical protein U1Q18_044450 [Sarracenia purpurea var. burkii]